MPAAVTARTTAGQEGQDLDGDTQDTDPALDASSDPSLSLPNSQTSSLNISSASQASHFHPSSIGTSQSSVDKLLRRHASPPSPPFSQETRLSQDGSRNGDLSVSQAISQEHEAPSRPTLTAPDQAPHSTANKHKVGSTLGQKRTSSGHVKSPSLSLSTSPVDIVSRGHSRHTSTASNSSQVGELSAQLRTRLSYAMVKVQNGWQSRTIDEVESLASQQTSPVATVPPLQQPFISPELDVMDLYRDRSGFAQSSERSTAPPSQTLQAPAYTIGHDPTYAKDPHPAYSPQMQSTGISQRGLSTKYPHYHSPTQAPSLAPSFDSGTRSSRRPNTSHTQPSPSYARGLSNLSASSRSSIKPTTPATPPQRRPPAIKTPSEKVSAMETDAIETLLFMSSPGNTQHRPASSHLPGTPLRSDFQSGAKKVGFAGDDYTTSVRPKHHGLSGSVDLGDDANIDKLLDQMPEDESSSDDEMLRPRLAHLC